MDTPRRALIVLLPTLLALPACDGGAEPDGLRVTTAALAPCADNENGDRRFPSNADKVVVRLEGGGIPEGEPVVAVFPEGSQDDSGQVILDELPPGDDMTLEAVACQGNQPTWGGLTGGVSVAVGETNPVDLFLTPVGDLACVGSADTAAEHTEMSTGHAFGATFSERDAGWILGGFSGYEVQQRRFRATNRVDRYDRVDSAFAEAGRLLNARGMAAVQPLADGRLRIVGGASEVHIDSSPDTPPLWTGQGNAPEAAVEIFDPAGGASVAGPDVDMAALPAVAALDDGRTLAVGGVGEDEPVARAWIVGEDDAITLDGLPQARFGATVVGGADQQALVWGGNVDGEPANVALWVDAAEETTVQLEPVGQADVAVPFMAAGIFRGASEGVQRFVIVGGTDVTPANGGAQYTTNATTPRVLLVEVDPGAGTFDATPLGLPDGHADLFRRAAATLTETSAGELLLLGGFTSFGGDPACPDAPDCLQQTIVRFRAPGAEVTLVDDGPIEANVGTLGATAQLLGDGSWLLGGGLPSVGGGAAIDKGAGLLRFRVDDAGLCAHAAPE
ncbi:MAG: hypothetical protein ACQEXJ_17185 [Myxococcota bacterium]